MREFCNGGALNRHLRFTPKSWPIRQLQVSALECDVSPALPRLECDLECPLASTTARACVTNSARRPTTTECLRTSSWFGRLQQCSFLRQFKASGPWYSSKSKGAFHQYQKTGAPMSLQRDEAGPC